jgi:two-component system, OmpR family, osmolarity sensor histidine kinase EnvZ
VRSFSFRQVAKLVVPGTLYVRFFWLQLAVLVMVTLTFLALFALNQTRSAMANIAGVWAPALREAVSANTQGQRETLTVSQQVELYYSAPPADAYAPNWTHLRWRALHEALRVQDVPVGELVVSGRTGEAIVWLRMGDAGADRWIGVRSNLEGADFPARWLIAMLLSLGLIGLAARWLAHKIATPLRKLEAAVRAYSAGKPFVAPALDAPREISTLIHAFEKMAREREGFDAQRALMLAGISHDLRSPLTRIRMAAELLPDHDGAKLQAERIARNVAVADALIASFSDYVRAESEPLNQNLDLVELARDSATAAGIEHVHLPANGPVWVRGSPHLLQRALNNLIDNAKKHGKPPVSIAMMCDAAAAGEVHLSVSDSGEGIAAQDRERLVRPFERGTASRAAPGSGLGLAIVVRVLQHHGGRLDIDATADGGARCVMVLPKA